MTQQPFFRPRRGERDHGRHNRRRPPEPTRPCSAYGLGKLDDASAESVSKHLEDCDSCQRRVAELSSDEFLGRLQNAQVKSDKSAADWPPSGASSTEGARGPVVPPPPVDTLPPELVDHPDYEIVRELGRGGMGVVYLAQNKLMGRLEVLKVVGGQLIERPGVRDRFLREIQSAAKLHHTNIVAAYSAMRLGESIVLAMEYVDGLRPGEDGQGQAARCRWLTPATSSTRRRWACSTPTSAAWSTATSSRPT